MHIPHDEIKIGALVRLEEGSYYCERHKKFVTIGPEMIGVIVHIFKYDEITYPWKTLGYRYLADLVMGPHKLRDVPNFKIHGV
jgi:hypothetical protein